MSFQSWCEEFYPIPASEVEEEDARQHSLTKWIGLRHSNLQKHGLYASGTSIRDKSNSERVLAIDSNSCALCQHYFNREADDNERCKDCPLATIRGNVPCDSKKSSEDISPYYKFISSEKNPELMIGWLEKCLSTENNPQ